MTDHPHQEARPTAAGLPGVGRTDASPAAGTGHAPGDGDSRGRERVQGDEGARGAKGAGVVEDARDNDAERPGVGPWEGPWPDDPRYDTELLANGDRRNVVDEFRYWTLDAIVAELDTRRTGLHVAIENWQHDLNIGSIVRTANAFNVAEVHIVGKRRWNRRGAMVTDRYQHISHHEDVADLVAWAAERGLPVLAVDNFPDAVPLETYAIPERCVMLFGQEGAGLSEEAHRASHAVLSIAQSGSTRSINAAAAAAIAMHAWTRRHVFGQL